MGKDLHSAPFDEGTLKKLEIFETYTKEWLPTFIMSGCKEMYIFDLFAGPGYSQTEQLGSPIRILRQIKAQIHNVFQKKCKIKIILNEFDKGKAAILKNACDEYCNADSELQRAIQIGYLSYIVISRDCQEIYPQVIEFVSKHRSLVFLDQNGVKFMGKEYFLPIAQCDMVDFLFYISSSYILRFGETPEFKNVISIDMKQAKRTPYESIHRNVLEQLRSQLPANSKTMLYPFSIKKNTNIYGIIFGASHPRAVDKFLKTAWKENSINGEANFDIDHDCEKMEPSLFGDEYHLPTKLEKFKDDLKKAILSGEVKNNREALDFTYKRGHINSHADEVIRKLKKDHLIRYTDSTPRVNYESVYRDKVMVEYELVKI